MNNFFQQPDWGLRWDFTPRSAVQTRRIHPPGQISQFHPLGLIKTCRVCIHDIYVFDLSRPSPLPHFWSQWRLEGLIFKHFGHQIQQVFGKHENVKTAHRKSSFAGFVFQCALSFVDACHRDLRYLPPISCMINIQFSFWTHLASILDPILQYVHSRISRH